MTTQTKLSKFFANRSVRPWLFAILLIYVLAAGAFFRFSGLMWGESQYLHPDERFLVWVGTDISPVDSLSQYFDTENSSLNPHNRGHGFYVYGTLPMFITRYMVEWIYGHSGFEQMTQVGRPLSALVDLLTVLLVYLVAERLYDRRVAILSAAFSAAAVLQIQQSHFFTQDTFMVAFSFLAFYFAVLIVTSKPGKKPPTQASMDSENLLEQEQESQERPSQISNLIQRFFRDPLFLPSLGFGIALGMGVASKLDAAPMAMALPIAMLIYLARLPAPERSKRAVWAFCYLVMAALASLLTFRLLQPYAFSGPGFFGLIPNPKWVANIRELLAQSSGDVDFPPAMQWARRAKWFSFQNMVLWGLGLPFGILAWTGFLWVGWRLLPGRKGRPVSGGYAGDKDANGTHNDRLSSLLIWGWTAAYFIWQSMRLNATMRYQLPLYPTLAIFAGWTIVALYDLGRSMKDKSQTDSGSPSRAGSWLQVIAILVGVISLSLTYAYAFAFSRLYTRPITRIAATRWIYENVPGPISLPIQTAEGTVNQSLPVPYSLTITPEVPLSVNFQPKAAGQITQVLLPRVKDQTSEHQRRDLTLTINNIPPGESPLASASLSDDLTPGEDPRGKSYLLTLDQPVTLIPEQTYNLKIELAGESPQESEFNGEVTLVVEPANGDPTSESTTIPLTPPTAEVRNYQPFIAQFQSTADGLLTQLQISQTGEPGSTSKPRSLILTSIMAGEAPELLYSALSAESPVIGGDPGSQSYLLNLEKPLPLTMGDTYVISLEMQDSGGVVTLSGLGIANEGEWDDGLPLRMDGYDGFGGIYPPDLNFNMYWDDIPEKLERFLRILDQADYIVISSNRQWGSLPRLPERFPMTSAYYRNLLGCPPELTIEYCYRIAEPGIFKGSLGYELVKVFTSEPRLGPIHLNDQFAEEAFTVYDHPKVLVFQKTEDYDSEKVRSILSAVDLSKVIRVAPMRAGSQPGNLMLPEERWSEQQEGGTWSELFNTQALHNRSQPLGVLVWYLSLSLLGLIVYPLLRLALPGLKDRGYPLVRTTGLLVLSYLVWVAGSLRIPFNRPTILAALGLMALLGAILAYRQREELGKELRSRSRYFLVIEGLTLAFFLFFLFVRYGNPDLWHPWKGGEKPMDFSYFNAVLKSTSFPPYDPWYAGGYLNYYYYGFMLVGVLVKLLGIVPAFAYNLILPTLFSMIAMGAFSLVWNLAAANGTSKASPNGREIEETGAAEKIHISPYVPAIAGALGMAVLGNLGTVRMYYQGLQRLVAPDGVIEGANLLQRWIWTARGLLETFQGAKLPYSIGDWYWIPSRAIPAPGDVEPITEFPYFTVLYADLHAHLLALPLTLLALAFCIGILLGQARWKSWVGGAAWFLLAGLSIGALRPTNTWDMPLYLALGVITTGYAIWRNFRPSQDLRQSLPFLDNLSDTALRGLATAGGMLLLIGLAFILYQPYAQWYALGYTKVRLWEGTHTTITAYLTHWGLFLFLIVSWLAWETRDWMAKTPMSALRKLAPYRLLIQILILVMLLIAATLFWMEVRIAILVLPLAAWTAVLIFRPHQPDAKRMVLFMIGTGLALTLMVELIVLQGDIGRMNTVFKFYLQVWTLFSISAAAGLGWVLPALPEWRPGWRWVWELGFALLVAGASLYTLTATMAKVDDRMDRRSPRTLDGTAFMRFAEYGEAWGPMLLKQDYEAIRWLQENVQGSPVIVEANLRNLYRWGSRYTIYTGLPGVVGWEWHQQQQRAVAPGQWVTNRILEVDEFYQTTDLEAAADFLRKYDVRYIIVGQQERGHYPGPGLDKFEAADGILWQEVYRKGDTVIYEVLVGDN